jgi:hypothetical protein
MKLIEWKDYNCSQAWIDFFNIPLLAFDELPMGAFERYKRDMQAISKIFFRDTFKKESEEFNNFLKRWNECPATS